MRILWSESKNDSNRRKHGVSFEEAKTLFTRGEDYLVIFDENHSGEEDRFLAIGPIARGLILVVYTEWKSDTIRIISARWANRSEKELFRKYAGGGTK